MKTLFRCFSIIALFLCFGPFASARSGIEHQQEILESLFGSRYQTDEAAKELIDYISQGMDFGDITREANLRKPGSSFLNALREKFPNFKGTHREFGHWAFDGDIPSEVIQDFEKVYPGKGEDFKRLWQQFVRTRREAARLGLGLTKEGSRAAQSITSLAGSCHDLGDWTTVQTEGLPPIKNVIRDIERSYHRLLGNNSKVVSEFIDELKAIPESGPPQTRAERILKIWKKNTKLHEATESVLKQQGFANKFNPLDYKAIAKYDKAVERALAQGALTPTPKPKPDVTKPVPKPNPKSTKVAPKPIAKPKIQLGRAVVRPAASAGKSVGKAAGRGAAKAGGRGVLSFIGRAAPIFVDVGFWLWGDYQIEDDFTKGRISDSERVEKKVVNTGRAVGGGVGALAGGAAGQYYNKNYGPASDGGGGGLGGFLIVAGAAIIGGIIGEFVGGETTKTVYEWVERPPYEVCSDACGIGDVDAQFFMGLYLHEGRYVKQDKGSAAGWFEASAREGDVRAQFYLGDHWKEAGVPIAAVFWWRMAANSTSSAKKYLECKAAAAYNLAGCYLAGEGVEENEFQGISYLYKASTLGNEQAKKDLDELLRKCRDELQKAEPDPGALKILGNYYSLFDGEDNVKRSFSYMYKAAKLGHPGAMNNIGNAYNWGDGVEKDLSKAIEWYQMAADEGLSIAVDNLIAIYDQNDMWDDATVSWLVERANEGHQESCWRLATFAQGAASGDEYKELYPFEGLSQLELLRLSVQLFERAEVMGDCRAKVVLARFAEDQFGKTLLSDSSPETYESRLRYASFKNNVQAQLMLAKARNSGSLISKDENKAAFYFALAALNGDAEAQSKYGDCCYYGRGTPKNLGKAARWFQKSAEQGYAYGEYSLGWCYAHGEGVSQDKARARYWLHKAAVQGYSKAQEVLDKL